MGSKEMEFHLWVTLLFTIFCQLSGTPPEEISMSSQESAMVGKKLFDTAPDGVLQVSRDKGLNTFLFYFEDILNKSGILREMTGMPVEARFNGLRMEDTRVKIELNKARLSSTASYNDLIKEEGKPAETLMYDEINVYDVKGLDSPNVFAVIKAKIDEKAADTQLRQQEIQNQGKALEQQNQPENPEDAALKQKYGAAANG